MEMEATSPDLKLQIDKLIAELVALDDPKSSAEKYAVLSHEIKERRCLNLDGSLKEYHGTAKSKALAIILEMVDCSSLVSLSLRKNGLRLADMKTLTSMPKFPELRILCLDDNELGDDGVKVLAVSLRIGWVPSLQELRISRCRVRSAGLTDLGNAFGTGNVSRSLKVLDLGGNRPEYLSEPDGHGALTQAMSSGYLPALEELYLQECGLQSIGLKQYADAISKGHEGQLALPVLKIIDFSSNRGLRSDKLQFLTKALSRGKACALREIHFSYNDLGDLDLELDPVVHSSATQLRKLVLRGSQLTKKGLQSIARFVSEGYLKGLEILDVSDNRVDVTSLNLGARSLCNSLKSGKLTHLRELLLANIGKGDEDLVTIATAVRSGHLKSLEILDVSDYQVNNVDNTSFNLGVRALCNSVKSGKLTHLRKLLLANIRIGPEDLVAIARAVKAGHLKSLEVLDVSGPRPWRLHEEDHSRGLFALATSSEYGQLSQLRELDLSGWKGEGLLAVAQAFEFGHLKSLQVLKIFNTSRLTAWKLTRTIFWQLNNQVTVLTNIELRYDITRMGFKSEETYNPQLILCLYDVVLSSKIVQIVFFHVEGMASLLGIGLPFSRVSIGSELKIVVEEISQDEYVSLWMNACNSFKPMVFERGVENPTSISSGTLDLSITEAVSSFGVGVDGRNHFIRQNARIKNESNNVNSGVSWLTESWFNQVLEKRRQEKEEEEKEKPEPATEERVAEKMSTTERPFFRPFFCYQAGIDIQEKKEKMSPTEPATEERVAERMAITKRKATTSAHGERLTAEKQDHEWKPLVGTHEGETAPKKQKNKENDLDGGCRLHRNFSAIAPEKQEIEKQVDAPDGDSTSTKAVGSSSSMSQRKPTTKESVHDVVVRSAEKLGASSTSQDARVADAFKEQVSNLTDEKMLIVVVEMSHLDCQLYDLDMPQVLPVTDSYRDDPVLIKCFIKPTLTIEFISSPSVRAGNSPIWSNTVTVRFEVDYQIDGNINDSEKFGWYQDHLCLSFKCEDPRASSLTGERVIGSKFWEIEDSTMSGNSQSLSKAFNKKCRVIGGPRDICQGEIQLGNQRESMHGSTNANEKGAKYEIECLEKASSFAITSRSVGNEMAYKAQLRRDIAPLQDYKLWDEEERKRAEAVIAGMFSSVRIDVKGTWQLFGNENKVHVFAAEKHLLQHTKKNVQEAKVRRSFQSLLGRRKSSSNLPVASSSNNTLKTLEQKISKKFLLNHSFSHLSNIEVLKKDTPYEWVLVEREESPVRELINLPAGA